MNNTTPLVTPTPPLDDVRSWHQWGVDQGSRLSSFGRTTVERILANTDKPHIQYKALGMLGMSFDDAVKQLEDSRREVP